MKTIGIIGGFGPEGTAQCYLRLIEEVTSRKLSIKPEIHIHHAFVSSDLEHDALVLGKRVEEFIPHLTRTARMLENVGTDLVILPCNTLHVHEHIIRQSTTAQFVSMIDATIEHLNKKRIHHIGILGSRITMKNNLFKQRAPDLTCIAIPSTLQSDIDIALDICVRTGDRAPLKKSLASAHSWFKTHNVKNILIACTDFHGLLKNDNQTHLHDTLDILVSKVVDMI